MRISNVLLLLACLSILPAAAQNGDTGDTSIYNDNNFKPSFISSCADGVRKQASGIDADGYCNCVFGKLAERRLPLSRMGELQDTGSLSFKEIILPCLQSWTVNTNNPEEEAKTPDVQVDNIPTVSVSDDQVNDASTDQNVSSMLSSSRDVFASVASYRMSQGGFRYRGYGNNEFTTLLNGVIVNDADNGQVYWGAWGGLNDVWLSRDNSVGLAPSVNAFGSPGGVSAIDTRAGHQRKGFKLSYTITNRSYRNRLMATYNTGYLKGGWALSVSFSRRWAQHGYQPGTYFDGYAYFLSVEKAIHNKHWISLTVFGTPTKNARAGAATHEIQKLAGTNYYNPFWGYQNGQIRNADEVRRHEPSFILTHEAKFTPKTSLLSGLNFSFGKSQSSELGWYNVQNPAPDYYRLLPSNIDDSAQSALAAYNLSSSSAARQLNWDGFYEVNRHGNDTIHNVNGVSGNDVIGKRARYFVSERVEDTKKINFNSTVNHSFNDIVSLTGGITYQWEKTRYYRVMKDLLGADFYVDLNQFAERDFPDNPSLAQNNIAAPNRLIKNGDEFGYNFYQNTMRSVAFLQPYFRFKRFDFFFGAQLSHSYFWRTGIYQNGLFLNNSKGDSKKLSFLNYAAKAGFTVKINGRNYIFGNGMLGTESPEFRASFLSPTLRNDVVPNLRSSNYYSAELGYNFTSPRFKAKVTGFFMQRMHETDNYRFYHDDYRNFVNYSLTEVSTRHYGVEIGAEAKVWKGLSIDAAASIGRYQYIDNAKATITIDNTAAIVDKDKTVYFKGFNVARTPQMAMTYGIRYTAKNWRAGVNFNYFDWMWVQINPIRRTTDAIDLVDKGSTLYHQIWDQERLKGQFTMDITGGYSWAISRTFRKVYEKTHKNFYLSLNASINNVTNNQNFVVSGNEQLRFDYFEKNPNKFASKYRYMQRIGFFVTLQLRMN
ncbi:MAG: TonB-dependent receptor [Chitinophagales bacterium]